MPATYSIKSKLCEKRGLHVSYEGESSRPGHLKNFWNRSKKSIMYRHVMAEHRKEGGLIGFEMNIVSGFKDCISRQIIEQIIRLRSKPQHLLMNPKWKFFGPVIKRKLHDEYKIRPVV